MLYMHYPCLKTRTITAVNMCITDLPETFDISNPDLFERKLMKRGGEKESSVPAQNQRGCVRFKPKMLNYLGPVRRRLEKINTKYFRSCRVINRMKLFTKAVKVILVRNSIFIAHNYR